MSQRFSKFELFYTPRFPLFFLVGMLILAVMGNMLTDLLKDRFGSAPWRLIFIFLISGVALALLVGAAHVAGAIQKKPLAEPYGIKGKPKPEKYKGLIAFVSGQEPDHLRKAVEYHSDKLQSAWLIATKETKAMARELQDEFESDTLSITVKDLDDPWDLAKAKRVVEQIYADELGDLGEEDVIADFTGGTKPMTVGMIFACMTPSRKLEYVPAASFSGKPKPLEPIEYALDSVREQTTTIERSSSGLKKHSRS
jgi:hypothetical protein